MIPRAGRPEFQAAWDALIPPIVATKELPDTDDDAVETVLLRAAAQFHLGQNYDRELFVQTAGLCFDQTLSDLKRLSASA